MYKYCLEREKLIDIINKHDNDKTTLSLLKEKIKFYDYYQDDRFMPELKDDNIVWRQDFLKEEAKEHIKNGDVDFAYKNLFELIRAENPALYGFNILKSCFKNELNKDKHENYYKDGFICEKEKNIIMEIINAIENYYYEISVMKNENKETQEHFKIMVDSLNHYEIIDDKLTNIKVVHLDKYNSEEYEKIDDIIYHNKKEKNYCFACVADGFEQYPMDDLVLQYGMLPIIEKVNLDGKTKEVCEFISQDDLEESLRLIKNLATINNKNVYNIIHRDGIILAINSDYSNFNINNKEIFIPIFINKNDLKGSPNFNLSEHERRLKEMVINNKKYIINDFNLDKLIPIFVLISNNLLYVIFKDEIVYFYKELVFNENGYNYFETFEKKKEISYVFMHNGISKAIKQNISDFKVNNKKISVPIYISVKDEQIQNYSIDNNQRDLISLFLNNNLNLNLENDNFKHIIIDNNQAYLRELNDTVEYVFDKNGYQTKLILNKKSDKNVDEEEVYKKINNKTIPYFVKSLKAFLVLIITFILFGIGNKLSNILSIFIYIFAFAFFVGSVYKIENKKKLKKENQYTNYSKSNNHRIKEKTKYLVQAALLGLMFGFTGFLLLMEFLKTQNILYIIISIMMFIMTLLMLSSVKKDSNKNMGYRKNLLENDIESKEHLIENDKMLEKETNDKLKKELEVKVTKLQQKQIWWNETGIVNDEKLDVQLTPELIETVEKELKHKLPKNYLDLLNAQNGGRLIKRYYCLNSFEEDILEIDSIHGISDDFNVGIIRGNRNASDWLEDTIIDLDNYIVFGEDISAGHAHYLFDYTDLNKSGEPKIIWFDNEVEVKILLADSFEEFINNLKSQEEIDLIKKKI